jgi:hypothetical protein
VNALVVFATLAAASAGGALAGRTVAVVDARLSGITSYRPGPTAWARGAVGLALLAAVPALAPESLSLLAAVPVGICSFAAGYMVCAVRLVNAEDARYRAAAKDPPWWPQFEAAFRDYVPTTSARP